MQQEARAGQILTFETLVPCPLKHTSKLPVTISNACTSRWVLVIMFDLVVMDCPNANQLSS